MKKFNFDIEIQDSERVSGGYLTTVKNLTKKQVAAEMERMGKELIRNSKDIDRACFSAWEEDNEDIENAACVFVTVRKEGRKFSVLVY